MQNQWLSFGYIKGIDRFLYQPSVRSMHSNDVIMESIEHLEAFKEKNNFLWICIPDLHDIADEFETRLSTQVKSCINNRVFEKTNETSVKKKYDNNKIKRYGVQLKRIHTYLGILFNYIKDGNTPKYFGGNNRRKYTITESVFPDNPYRYLEHKIFFNTKDLCTKDGRIKLQNFSVQLINKLTNKDETDIYKEKVDKYTNIAINHIKEFIIIDDSES